MSYLDVYNQIKIPGIGVQALPSITSRSMPGRSTPQQARLAGSPRIETDPEPVEHGPNQKPINAQTAFLRAKLAVGHHR